MQEARAAANEILCACGDQDIAIAAETDADAKPVVGIIMGSDSDLWCGVLFCSLIPLSLSLQ